MGSERVEQRRRDVDQHPATEPVMPVVARRTMFALGAQASLMVGGVDDPAEREADATADLVIARLSEGGAGSAPAIGTASAGRIRRAAAGDGGGEVDPETAAELRAAKSGGSALPAAVRSPMEQAFGAGFGRVRLHADARSAELNRKLDARAFTLGSDVYLRRKEDLQGESGQRLLAHELTHVVQQGHATQPTIRRAPEVGTEPAEADGVDAGGAAPGGIEPGEEGMEIGTIEHPSLEVRKGPDDRPSPAHRSRRRDAGAGVPVQVGSFDTAVSSSRSSAASGHADAVAARNMPVFWHNPGGKDVEPFGEEGFNPAAHFVTWSRKKKGDPIRISFLLRAKCDWGVDGDDKIDIKSGSSSKITADNYEDIVDDLTPVLEEKSWRAPRDTYWSKAICERHEKFHSTDDRKWVKGDGASFLKTWIGKQTIDPDLSSKEITAEVKDIVEAGLEELSDANVAFYKGGASSYCSYAGEERAFGDGKQPYLDLAAAVKKTGEKKKRAADKKAQKKAGRGATASAESS